ncbi:MAG: fimbrillin family protein [Bacteroidales bacterium]|jgi:hypothetical protein|nr:fimbrillin family protein [Bacteroidales bacterium]
MKKLLLLAAVGMLLAVSCNKGEELARQTEYGDANKAETVFYASTEGTATPGTKVYADEDLRVLWNADDRISIFNKTTTNAQYKFTGGDGDNSGGFEEVQTPKTRAALDHIYAVYPYSSSNAINDSGSQITVNLPAQQAYRAHSFGVGANTMVAVTDGQFLGFKNACGYLRFRFYGDNVSVSSVKLEGNNGEQIAGKAYIAPVVGGVPTLSMDATATSSITMNCTEAVTLGTSSTDFTEFIFVIPPTTFSNGFKVTVTDNNGAVFEKSSSKSLTISRNKIESMGAMKVVPVNRIYTLVTGYDELTEGSEILIVSTPYDYAMGTAKTSQYTWRQQVAVTKSSDKSTITNPSSDVQVFTLQKGSADNTFMLECKNGDFAGQYIGIRTDNGYTTYNYSPWTYLYNCAASSEYATSYELHIEDNYDANITAYNISSKYKYICCDYYNSLFKANDVYVENYAVAIYKLEGSGEGGDQLIIPTPEIHFTSGVNVPVNTGGMIYVGNTQYLPATGGTYTVGVEVLYPKDGGYFQNVIQINGGGTTTISGLTVSWNETKTQLTITLPENTSSSARSAYIDIEYSYYENGWVNLKKRFYIAQSGATAIK